MSDLRQAASRTLAAATRRLLAERDSDGVWRGELSAGALSTATAAFALHLADADAHAGLIEAGLGWLARNANDDGGWGDTPISESNLSATLLAWSALSACDRRGKHSATISHAEAWLGERVGSLAPADIAEAVAREYGKDRTFSVPILTMIALARRLGHGPDAWKDIPALPFELSLLPHGFWSRIRLPVVSYAAPALIAMGLVRHRRAGGHLREGGSCCDDAQGEPVLFR